MGRLLGVGEGGRCGLAAGWCFVRIHSGPKCMVVLDISAVRRLGGFKKYVELLVVANELCAWKILLFAVQTLWRQVHTCNYIQ